MSLAVSKLEKSIMFFSSFETARSGKIIRYYFFLRASGNMKETSWHEPERMRLYQWLISTTTSRVFHPKLCWLAIWKMPLTVGFRFWNSVGWQSSTYHARDKLDRAFVYYSTILRSRVYVLPKHFSWDTVSDCFMDNMVSTVNLVGFSYSRARFS